MKGSKSGLGDLDLGNGLHWTFPNYEMVNAFDLSIPTGAYEASDLVNPGLNHWAFRLNNMGTVSYTHLDVYKRQSGSRPPAGSSRPSTPTTAPSGPWPFRRTGRP